MQNQANRWQWTVLLVALRVVWVGDALFRGPILYCVPFHSARLCSKRIVARYSRFRQRFEFSDHRPGGNHHHRDRFRMDSRSNGTSVVFGYQVYSNCSIVADSQSGSISSGSFSGWFRWPSGTAQNTFQVCAMIGSVMAVAGSFSVLSSSPPSVSISPSTLAPNTHATITASNYYPAGTPVNFAWMSGNTVIDNLNSINSNTSGVAILAFTVPNFSIASGSYAINATAGGGQPATLFSSTNFTYHPPVVSPSPTPNPSPTPSPTPFTHHNAGSHSHRNGHNRRNAHR